MPLPHPLAIIGMLCGFALTPASVWADCQPVAGTTDAITVARAKAASNNAAEHVDLPRVGERFTVTIPQPDTEVADVTVCFDNIEVKPELHDKNKPPLPAVYWIVVPSVANVSSGMVPFGDHALHVRWSYVLKDNSKQPAEDRYDFLL